ncbi:MAG: tetratricopeptide repeat protein [Phycisphaeraceae bacterium]|nr:tetratricopeptide repeat protein [Phycisphaeraceae bacterium]
MPSLEQLERLLAADPDDAFVLYGLAQEHAKRGDLVRAIEFYDRCLSVDPAYCYAYFHKARAQQSQGNVAGAIATVKVGMAKAQVLGDSHAAAELSGLLDELE